MDIDVIEIYPNSSWKHTKLKESGTVHVKLNINELQFEIKNIRYQIFKNGKIKVLAPYHAYYQKSKEKNKSIPPVMVPTLTFKDPTIMKNIINFVKEEIKKEL